MEAPTMQDVIDFIQQARAEFQEYRVESQGIILDLQRDMQRHVNETMGRAEDRLRMKIDTINERVSNLDSRSPTRLSRANSFGSRDDNNVDQDAKASAVKFQQESQLSEEEKLGEQLSHLEHSETEDGRTSMRSVIRGSGDRRPKNSTYLKNVTMGTESSDTYTVQPTIKIPLFEHKLRSTQPGAILRFVREWVRYQTEYGVKVNPLAAVQDSVLRKNRHTQNVDDVTIRDCTDDQFANYLAADLVMDNSFMFFNEL
jgi:hypothetical protein